MTSSDQTELKMPQTMLKETTMDGSRQQKAKKRGREWKASSHSRQQQHLALDTSAEGERVVGTSPEAVMLQTSKLPDSYQHSDIYFGAHLHAGDASTVDKRGIDPELREGFSARYSDEQLREGLHTKWVVQGTPDQWILDSGRGSLSPRLYEGRTDEHNSLPHFCFPLFVAKLTVWNPWILFDV